MRGDEMGFRCQKCGGATRVIETREVERGVRRRRTCLDKACNGRVTTLEFIVPSHTKHDGQDMVFVKRRDLARLRDIAAALTSQRVIGWKELLLRTGGG